MNIDPLSEVTRKERKLLLLTSTVAYAVAKIGLFPTKIQALGIEFNPSNLKAIPLTLIIVLFYFLCAFAVYSVSDVISWLIDFRTKITKNSFEDYFRKTVGTFAESNSSIENVLNDMEGKLQPQQRDYVLTELHRSAGSLLTSTPWKLVKPISLIRLVFEIALPVLWALYCIELLYKVKI